MYIRDKLIKFLKIKNVIFIIAGIFNVAVSVYTLISLFSTYRDMEIVMEAKAAPGSIMSIKIGIILLIIAVISRHLIGDANFYSSYFEGDLDGYIKYSDLAEVTGKNKYIVMLQLCFFRLIYMKGYTLKFSDDSEQVILNSKKCLCECKNCGAPIEKRIYFTGICSYCGSSDLFARVLTDNKFYSIQNNVSDGVKNPGFYTSKNLTVRKVLFPIFLILGLSIVCILTMMCLDYICKYNDKDYLTEVLLSGKSYSSFELIKREIMDMIIWDIVFIIAFIPLICSIIKKMICVYTADDCSCYFSRCKTPFVDIEKLPIRKNKSAEKRKVKSVNSALRHRYLINCTFEKHDGNLKLALAKKVVKDQCPSCGAPIVGAVDEHYKCKYCDNIIMGVISKK
ncbi:MAG: hypothetical protein NC247_08085 [Ruminococcus flavefaciens]|nr:hypothetical protein [Ruminococcus flavefaciens]MCM1361704.1 hypothetical protein [Clostridiales bacterium]MCM1435499.1 hypothetical protein [Ruminococcus flavefaciens]